MLEADGGSRTRNPRITNAVLYQLKLHRHFCLDCRDVQTSGRQGIFHTLFQESHKIKPIGDIRQGQPLHNIF